MPNRSHAPPPRVPRQPAGCTDSPLGRSAAAAAVRHQPHCRSINCFLLRASGFSGGIPANFGGISITGVGLQAKQDLRFVHGDDRCALWSEITLVSRTTTGIVFAVSVARTQLLPGLSCVPADRAPHHPVQRNGPGCGCPGAPPEPQPGWIRSLFAGSCALPLPWIGHGGRPARAAAPWCARRDCGW